MIKRFLVNTSVCVLAALLLCLSLTACGNSGGASYMSVSGGVVAIDLEMALGGDNSYKNAEKIFKQIVRELQKSKEPYNALVLSGSVPGDALKLLEPVAENITELNMTDEYLLLKELKPFKNLQVLRLESFRAPSYDNADDGVVALRGLPQLREWFVQNWLIRTDLDNYKFSKGLKESGLPLTINGQTLDEWEPFNELESDDKKYYYTSILVVDMFFSDYDAYTASAETPPEIEGKIIIGELYEAIGNTEFEFFKRFSNHSEFLATSPDECSAIIIVHYEYKWVGNYDGGGQAYETTTLLEVIDPVNKIRYEPVHFRTTEPPVTKQKGSQSAYGDKSYFPSSVIEYINDLE